MHVHGDIRHLEKAVMNNGFEVLCSWRHTPFRNYRYG